MHLDRETCLVFFDLFLSKHANFLQHVHKHVKMPNVKFACKQRAFNPLVIPVIDVHGVRQSQEANKCVYT